MVKRAVGRRLVRLGTRSDAGSKAPRAWTWNTFGEGMLLGQRPLLTSAISNGGLPCHLQYVVVLVYFEEKADCFGRPSATVVHLLNTIVGRKNSLPQNFADLGDQPRH
jgi:hypothetical protein